MIAGKIWGSTECVLATPLFELHRLIIKPKHQCSRHLHRRKHNCFVVTKGRLFIDVWRGRGNLPDVTELWPGDVTTVKPGEKHRFRTEGMSCEAFEAYFTDVLGEDIERDDHGGAVRQNG